MNGEQFAGELAGIFSAYFGDAITHSPEPGVWVHSFPGLPKVPISIERIRIAETAESRVRVSLEGVRGHQAAIDDFVGMLRSVNLFPSIEVVEEEEDLAPGDTVQVLPTDPKSTVPAVEVEVVEAIGQRVRVITAAGSEAWVDRDRVRLLERAIVAPEEIVEGQKVLARLPGIEGTSWVEVVKLDGETDVQITTPAGDIVIPISDVVGIRRAES